MTRFAVLAYISRNEAIRIINGVAQCQWGKCLFREREVARAVRAATHDGSTIERLQAILAASDAGQLTFLVTATGKPFTGGSFTNWFGALCRAAGLPLGLSAHGLRKAMCRRLAEAGCSANQIAAISGHATLQEVSRYTKAADQRPMAIDAMEAITGTPSVNPPALNWKPHRK